MNFLYKPAEGLDQIFNLDILPNFLQNHHNNSSENGPEDYSAHFSLEEGDPTLLCSHFYKLTPQFAYDLREIWAIADLESFNCNREKHLFSHEELTRFKFFQLIVLSQEILQNILHFSLWDLRVVRSIQEILKDFAQIVA